MNPSTPNTEPPPSTGVRKTVFGFGNSPVLTSTMTSFKFFWRALGSGCARSGLAAACLGVLGASWASGEGIGQSRETVDQSQEKENSYMNLVRGQPMIQSFVPSANANLTAIALKLGGKPTAPDGTEVTVSIRADLKDSKDKNLTTGKIRYPLPTDGDGWVKVALRPVELDGGTPYYLVIEAPDGKGEEGTGEFGWVCVHAPAIYEPGGLWLGEKFERRNGSVCFRTYTTKSSTAKIPANGDPLVGIVLPASPSPSEKVAARDLQRCLTQMTGVKLPVRSETDSAALGGRTIQVGRTKAAADRRPVDGWETESILVGYSSGDIVLVGGSDTATLFATYRFLRDLGCRWLEPGERGEVIPRAKTLALARKAVISKPDFAVRGWMASPSYSLIDMGVDGRAKGPFGTNLRELGDWGVRNGLNSTSRDPTGDLGEALGHGYIQEAGHTLGTWIPSGNPQGDQLFGLHPEYYPLADGVRVARYKDGRPVEACLSNPEVVKTVAEQVIAYLQQHPGTRRINVSHNDEPTYWCECAGCRAMDAPNSTWKKNDFLDAYPDQSIAGPGSMSDRWVAFANQVAMIVGPKFPQVYIAFYAYGSTVAPPRRPGWKLEKNLMVEYANAAICFRHSMSDPSCNPNKNFADWLTGWADSGQPVVIYDYEHNPGRWHSSAAMDFPACWYTGLADYVRFAKKKGVYGWAGENGGIWIGSGLWFYLKAHLLWDSEQDVRKLITDFCHHSYGPAGQTMEKYYWLLDSVSTGYAGRPGDSLDNAIVTRAWPSMTTGFAGHLGDSLEAFTPAVLTQADLLLQRAISEVTDEPTRLHVAEARVSFLGLRMALLEKSSQTDKSAHDLYDGYLEEAARLLRSCKAPFPISNGLCEQMTRSYVPPFEAMAGEAVLELPIVWKFRIDPNGEGDKNGWSQTKEMDENWKEIRTDSAWTEQKFPGSYHGTAWYVIDFEVPEKVTGKLWLLFGAIDGDSWLWINGKPAGSGASPNVAWDKPFGLDITNLAIKGQRNRLVVKVSKDRFAAGIWKPVRLMESKRNP